MNLNRWCTSFPLFLSISLLMGCEQSSTTHEDVGPRPVKTVAATAEQEQSGRLPGVVRARIETDLAFRTLGRVASRKVNVGDLVLKGDIVAEIDPLALRLAVRRAEADLLDSRGQFENAALIERRTKTLARKSAASVADRDLAEQQLKSASANVAKATAALAKAYEQLGHAELRAEFDGVVTATFGEMGQTVSAGQTILRLARLEQRDVVVDVPEAQFRSVRLDDRFKITLQLDSTVQTFGVVREIGPQADASTRTHRLKIALDQASEVFRLGAVVTATPMLDVTKQAISLPIAAISYKDGADHVWVVNQSTGTVTPRTVHLQTPSAGARSVRISSGLWEGEEVVIAGVNELADGQKVKLEQGLRP
jgi:RND family efflux transporter MFP subunit